MAQRLATPGVYVEERNAFPNSVAGLATAVPAFVGFTEKAVKGGRSATFQPIRVSSLAEFSTFFGGSTKPKFNVAVAEGDDFDFTLGEQGYKIEPDSSTGFFLYNAMRLFFDNGGGACWVVSIGTYGNKTADISKTSFEKGIQAFVSEDEPTMLLAPEAVMLAEGDCYAVQQLMLQHCGSKMKNRIAILDVHNGYNARTYDANDVVTRFRQGVGNNNLNYGAAYYPWLQTTIVQANELDYNSISNVDMLIDVLTKEADGAGGRRADEIKAELQKMKGKDTNAQTLQQTLVAVSPLFRAMMSQVRLQANVMPPSAALAGIYTAVDSSRGVWKAPANVSINSAVAPTVNLTSDDQEDLNVTITGKSINAIRPFAGEGLMVWGARTLDGNSQDWRYINVRRTLIFIEQSVKNAAKSYVFEPNDAGTWISVRAMLTNFLTSLWNQGALSGASPEQAYEVQIGLGSTMTPNDILDGIMRITVKVAVSRPAEFIVITFQQKMLEAITESAPAA